MMKIAIPICAGRVSPVLDVAQRLVVAQIEAGEQISRKEESVAGSDLFSRAGRIGELGVDILICGAVSGTLEDMLRAKGVEVIPWICGPVDNVLELFISGQPFRHDYVMPGCCGRRRQGRGRGGRRGWYPR